jgi:hypothetical protein
MNGLSRETIIPGIRSSTRRDALHLRAEPDGRIVAQSGGSLVSMSGRNGLVLSLVDAFSHQRIEIARVDDIVRVPHMVVVGTHGYFVSDTRRLYGLDLDRLTLSSGMRIAADKVLPLVGAAGNAFLPHVVDTDAGWVTLISRVVSEHEVADTLEIAGELYRVGVEDDRIVARGERMLPDRPMGRPFEVAWAPASRAMPLVTMMVKQYDDLLPRPAVRLLNAPALVPSYVKSFAHGPNEGDEIRPPPRRQASDRGALANDRADALTALENEIGRTLPALYCDLYETGFADAALRIRLQRIGLVLSHPMYRPRELASRGLVPFADADDATLCLNVTEASCVPVVRVSRTGEMEEIASDFDAFFDDFLCVAANVWPTTVLQIRATLGLE